MSEAASVLEFEVIQYFKNNHVSVPREWILACINWIQEEHNSTNLRLDAKEVPRLAYGQWLTANLRELETSCLPSNVQNVQKTLLEGYFPLQIECIRDIGQPAYQQYLKVSKIDHSNAEVTAEPPNYSQMEKQQASRMLKFEMTDGTQNISGMEYELIPFMNLNMPPGIKVLVYGRIECRRGILLLTKDNVKVLGGDVLDLRAENTQTCVLQRALNHPQGISGGGADDTGTLVNQNQTPNGNGKPSSSSVLQSITSTITPEVTSTSCFLSSKKNSDPLEDVWDDMDFVFEDDTLLDSVTNHAVKTFPKRSDCEKLSLRSSDGASTTSLISDHNSTIVRQQSGTCNSNISLSVKKSSLNTGINNSPSLPETNSFRSMSPLPEIELLKNKSLTTTRVRPNISSFACDSSQDSINYSKCVPVIDLDDDCSSVTLKSEPVKQATTCSSKIQQPFQYLCHLPPLPSLVKFSYRVKAFVMTLASNLESNSGQKWHLKALINDGTASLMVDFSDNVLQNIMCMSAMEYYQLKQISKTDPEARQRKSAVLKQCSQHLINLSCIMDLEILPGTTTPYVRNLEEPTKSTLVALRSRQVQLQIY